MLRDTVAAFVEMGLLALALSVVFVALACEASFNCSEPNLDRWRKVFLNYHNDARSRLANGNEPNKQGKFNKASNMNKLNWSCEMEEKAKELIKTCGSVTAQVGPYAANVAYFHGAAASEGYMSQIIPLALKVWWQDGKKYGVPSTNEYNNCGLFNFAQMANARATEIACATNKCGDKRAMICLYNTIGNIRGQPMWETGEPCSECVNTNTCENGLCVRPREEEDDGTSKICHNKGMTDKIRMRILNTHNHLRSRTARGLARNGTQGFAPTAAAMYKLKYDCYLEEMAYNHASKCVYRHTPVSARPNIGENLFQTSHATADRVVAGEWATTEWFAELKQHGVYEDNIYSYRLSTRSNMVVGHYTQVVWGITQYVGCAVVNCPSQTMVVCNYSPAGNMFTQLIYEPGETCKKCPATSTCSDDGLCTFPDAQ